MTLLHYGQRSGGFGDLDKRWDARGRYVLLTLATDGIARLWALTHPSKERNRQHDIQRWEPDLLSEEKASGTTPAKVMAIYQALRS